MASISDTSCFTFTWVIENFSYCWQKQKEFIESPAFTVEQTKWTLKLYPRGSSNADYIGYFLRRGSDGIENIEVNYELQFIANDGSVLKSLMAEKTVFPISKGIGFPEFEKRSDVFLARKDEFLPLDTLTARCKIWSTDDDIPYTSQVFSRTIIEVHKGTFVWPIEKFTALSPELKSYCTIKSTSDDSPTVLELSSSSGQHYDEVININIAYSNVEIKFFTFETFVLDFNKCKIDCGKKEFIVDGVSKTDKFTINQLRHELNCYLPSDGKLRLNCVYGYSTGIVIDKIENIEFGISSEREDSTHPVIKHIGETCTGKNKLISSSSLKEDLQSLYCSGSLSDIKLCTKTETFPAHVLVLSARSPVFKAMFTNDTKERAKKSVDILDVDDATIRSMLLYIYTDALDDLDWEKAANLYAAADKYEIMSLKMECSSLLKTKLCNTNACQILVLADMHQDEDLTKFVQTYILRNDKIVLHSEEWKNVMKTNCRLAMETMYLKWEIK